MRTVTDTRHHRAPMRASQNWRGAGEQRARARLTVFLTAAAAVGLSSQPDAALADSLQQEQAIQTCVSRALTMDWSYPEQGATDVPLNADLLLMSNNAVDCQNVSLNGVPLQPQVGRHVYDMGDLAPNTDYEVKVACSPGSSTPPLRLKFTSGSRVVETALAPVNVERINATHETSVPNLDDSCTELEWLQGCFDTGAPARFELQASGAAKLWLIEEFEDSILSKTSWLVPMPAVCGAPVRRAYNEMERFRVHSVHEDGSIVSGEWRNGRSGEQAPKPKSPPAVPPPPGVDVPEQPTSGFDNTPIPADAPGVPWSDAADSAGGCSVRESGPARLGWVGALLALGCLGQRRRRCAARSE